MTSNGVEISLVLAVYNEAENLEDLYRRVKEVLSKKIGASHEIIFVDDGSKDGSWATISKIAGEDKCVRAVKFSRNFGHQYALKAGLEYSAGNCVVTMDSDLQHPPEIIIKMYEEWKKGAEVVNAIRQGFRNTGVIKEFSSKAYYFMVNLFSEVNIPYGASDFRLLDRKVVEEINRFGEYHIFLRGLVDWLGFKEGRVLYSADRRGKGKPKYTPAKMFELAISGIMAFGIQPLRLAMVLGGIIVLFALGYMGFVFYAKFFMDATVPGWTAIVISVLIMGGAQIMFTGVVGEYVGRVFLESKKRPRYIVSEKL